MNLRQWELGVYKASKRLVGLFLVFGACAHAQDFSLESAGVRGGASFTSNAHNFHEVDGFVNWNLPWDWNLNDRWRLESRLDFSLGWLADPGADAVVGTLGPSFIFKRENFPLSFEGGVSPTLISRSDFGTKDFAIPFQFTSHVGLSFDFWDHFRIGYRFQHMSNAGLALPNPGLNLHMLELSYCF